MASGGRSSVSSLAISGLAGSGSLNQPGRGRYAHHPELPGTAVAGEGGGRYGCPGHPYSERARYVFVNARPERSHRYDLLCRREYDLFLAPPARTDGARVNRMAGRVRVGPARGGTAPAARRFLHWAAGRILPVGAGPRIPSRARAVAAHQRCRHTGDAISAYIARCVNQWIRELQSPDHLREVYVACGQIRIECNTRSDSLPSTMRPSAAAIQKRRASAMDAP